MASCPPTAFVARSSEKWTQRRCKFSLRYDAGEPAHDSAALVKDNDNRVSLDLEVANDLCRLWLIELVVTGMSPFALGEAITGFMTSYAGQPEG